MSERPEFLKCETCPFYEHKDTMHLCRRFPIESRTSKGSFCGEHPEFVAWTVNAEPEPETATDEILAAADEELEALTAPDQPKFTDNAPPDQVL